MPDVVERLLTVEEFLAWDDGTDRRYELVHGRILAMAPPAVSHARLCARLITSIASKLRQPCEVVSEAGIIIPDRNDLYYQADLAVSCSFSLASTFWIPDPVLIIEVTSPSTAAHDRGTKLPDYRTIDSLHEVLLVSSVNRRVEHWRREDDRWVAEDRVASGMLTLSSIAVELDLSALYEGVLD